jgi:hypothetical protein
MTVEHDAGQYAKALGRAQEALALARQIFGAFELGGSGPPTAPGMTSRRDRGQPAVVS